MVTIVFEEQGFLYVQLEQVSVLLTPVFVTPNNNLTI